MTNAPIALCAGRIAHKLAFAFEQIPNLSSRICFELSPRKKESFHRHQRFLHKPAGLAVASVLASGPHLQLLSSFAMGVARNPFRLWLVLAIL
jgi:hypothetical protein